MRSRLIAVPALLLALSTLAACSGDEGGNEALDPAATAGEPTVATTTCDYPTDGMDPSKPVEKPDAQAPKEGLVDVTVATSAGDIKAELTSDDTPCTVHSFLSLARQGYFDGTTCHRLTTDGIFVLQCGDPTASGMGGPGYSFADELTGSETYPAGTLAMANAGPDTNGSQFFIVYAATQLPPSYTVFGHLEDPSTAIVAGIAAQGTANGGPDGPPKQTVTITSVTRRASVADPNGVPLVSSSPDEPEPPADAISWDESRNFVGESRRVCGPLAGSGSDKDDFFLNLGRDYPDPDRFTIVLWDVGGVDMPAIGTTLCVRGDITKYNGVTQIEVRSASAVEGLE